MKTAVKGRKPAAKYTTAAAFSKALGISEGGLSQLRRRDDCPIAGNPPWTSPDVASVLRWREENLKADAAKLDHHTADAGTKGLRKKKLEQEIRKIRAQADSAELTVHREKGKLLDADDVEAGIIERIHAIRSAMQSAGSRLSIALVGVTDPARVERIVEDEMRSICARFEQGYSNN